MLYARLLLSKGEEWGVSSGNGTVAAAAPACWSPSPALRTNSDGQFSGDATEALLAHCQIATQWAGLSNYGNALRTLVSAAEKMPDVSMQDE